jgi:hypothetical protein
MAGTAASTAETAAEAWVAGTAAAAALEAEAWVAGTTAATALVAEAWVAGTAEVMTSLSRNQVPLPAKCHCFALVHGGTAEAAGATTSDSNQGVRLAASASLALVFQAGSKA